MTSTSTLGELLFYGLAMFKDSYRKLKYLEEEECVEHLAEMVHLTVSDIMTPNPICLQPVVSVGELYDCLKAVKHNCFPIVDVKHGDILVGTVLRKVLCMLIKLRAFGRLPATPNTSNEHSHVPHPSGSRMETQIPSMFGDERMSPMVSWGALECVYPDFPDVDEITLNDADR
jgi:CBS-domain-containing membrane protein